jgi:hypothetical protein
MKAGLPGQVPPFFPGLFFPLAGWGAGVAATALRRLFSATGGGR